MRDRAATNARRRFMHPPWEDSFRAWAHGTPPAITHSTSSEARNGQAREDREAARTASVCRAIIKFSSVGMTQAEARAPG